DDAAGERIVLAVGGRIAPVIDHPPERRTLGGRTEHPAGERRHHEMAGDVRDPLGLPLPVEGSDRLGDVVLAPSLVEGPFHPAPELTDEITSEVAGDVADVGLLLGRITVEAGSGPFGRLE